MLSQRTTKELQCCLRDRPNSCNAVSENNQRFARLPKSTTKELQCEACVAVQARVSEAQLQGEANCASLQTKLDKSAATMQNVASEHQELSRQRKALDRKLVRCCQHVMQ